ncbi:MAG: hypothetical protein E2598_04560 [Sphingobium sp.]|nr:hypothetical protein [Sphingobium sp.]
MTAVYITIDTEYSAGMALREGAACRAANFAGSIAGHSEKGDAGIFYQMDSFDRYGLKAVFFVDPMPALLWGTEAIADIVQPIIKRGHDVQLHLHTEWLALAGEKNPLGDRQGHNIRDFSYDEQLFLLNLARSLLMEAGAPSPIAFRAGNYGANDDTLRALAQLGIRYDSSHCPGIAGGYCDISLSPAQRLPIEHCGIIEMPVASIAARGGRQRHAQITALSAGEMLAAIRHARDEGLSSFSLVSHSFELMSRDRKHINHILRRRFEHFCAGLAAMKGVSSATYAANPPDLPRPDQTTPLLPHSPLRTAWRMGEQMLGNFLYRTKS